MKGEEVRERSELLVEDVKIEESKKEGERIITVNCRDKIGLGCDLCRIILSFGLTVVSIDVSTDVNYWCFALLWAEGKPSTSWDLLKERLMEACPSSLWACGISDDTAELQPPKPPVVFLLKLCCHNRRGLLHDVTQALCKLELRIKKVKVSTTPDGKVMDLFITDARGLLHTEKRKDETFDSLKAVLGDAGISCDLFEASTPSQGPSFLSDAITEVMFDTDSGHHNSIACKCPTITMDNRWGSSCFTRVEIVCQEHKGLLYDVMRNLKDYDIKIASGRFATKGTGECELELFLKQADGKIADYKQNILRSRLQKDLSRPLRVALVSRGPDTELLVANPIELSGKGRPLVFHDITLALKILNTPILSAEIGRFEVGRREWEGYRVLLDEGDGNRVSKELIEETVWKMLMGWK